MTTTSIIHKSCGEEAFKYSGDTSPGAPLIADFVIDYHHGYIPMVGGHIICKACDQIIGGPFDLYPDEAPTQ